MPEDFLKFKNLLELREDVRDYFGVKNKEDVKDISSDIDLKIRQLGKEELGSEIIEKLDDLKSVAEDFLEEELALRDEKLGSVINEITQLIDRKIVNVAKKIEVVS